VRGLIKVNEASISFLKKRNKKLLFVKRPFNLIIKSFLVLFFKKELLLPYCSCITSLLEPHLVAAQTGSLRAKRSLQRGQHARQPHFQTGEAYCGAGGCRLP
jgi:hypothetical protein